MKAADLKIGQEYQITAQPNPKGTSGPGRVYVWPQTYDSGPVKLLRKENGRYVCQYLENPYMTYREREGKGEITVSGRSLLRPWKEIVDKKEDDRERLGLWRQAQKDRQIEAERLIKDLPWLQASVSRIDSVDVRPIDKISDLPGDAVVSIDIPMSVLRGLLVHAEQHGIPQEILLEVKDQSALSELLS